jgi:outer membrane protein assembly factor BamB
VEVDGERLYIWCSAGGVVGVSAKTGDLLWKLPEWKIKIATVPSPLDLGGGRILLTGGYNAGSAAYQLHCEQGKVTAQPLFRCDAQTFGSDQQTPILFNGSIYGVIPGGKLACLSLDGQRMWVNEENNFGLGPYLLVDGKLLVLDDDHNKPGELCLFKLEGSGATKLAGAKVLEGHDAWAPIAFANGKAILRDATTLVCLDLSGS